MDLPIILKGYYTYGKGYPFFFRLKRDYFEFKITQFDGIKFKGTCIDEVTKEIEGNEATIQGLIENKKIYFKKLYKYHPPINSSNVDDSNYKSHGVDYVGEKVKKLFSSKSIYKGTWSISIDIIDENNRKQTFVSNGKWKMSTLNSIHAPAPSPSQNHSLNN